MEMKSGHDLNVAMVNSIFHVSDHHTQSLHFPDDN